jgi:2-haloacid dehalogenase
MTVRAVVFDLGGVLIDWNPRYLYRDVFADDDEMEHFLGSVCTMEWHYQHDLGRPMAVTLPEHAARFPEYRDAIMLWGDENAMIGGSHADVVEVLRDVCARSVPCYALTNWPAETFPAARKRFEFLDWFEGILVSGEEGVGKPDHAVFRLLCERFDLDPQSTLFVDDTAGNIDAAHTLGFRTHRFRGAAELRSELTRLGIL